MRTSELLKSQQEHADGWVIRKSTAYSYGAKQAVSRNWGL